MLKKVIKKIFNISQNLVSGFFWYVRDLIKYVKLNKTQNNKILFKIFPQIFDRDPASHTFDKHYVYMDRWAFGKILEARPVEHVDVGSSIRFLSMASIVTKLRFVDIRPIKLDFNNFECIEGSILKMPFEKNTIKSLSCLHVAEHIGLGRYGDPLDPEGTKKACVELSRVLAVGGVLLFAVPIGRSAVYFNAHRVHEVKEILNYFPELSLKNFSAINDAGHFVENASIKDYDSATYSCGCFEFIRQK